MKLNQGMPGQDLCFPTSVWTLIFVVRHMRLRGQGDDQSSFSSQASKLHFFATFIVLFLKLSYYPPSISMFFSNYEAQSGDAGPSFMFSDNCSEINIFC